MKQVFNIKELFNIYKGSIISIVGSGGKTTLLFLLAAELKPCCNVLVTTSTKIYRPSIDKYDYLYHNIDSFINSYENRKNNITVIAKSFDENNNKLIGINNEDLEKLQNYFDVILIEADGSRNLPLKGWKVHEPTVLKKTNKTIGIIPIDVLGRKIDESFIYGFEEFTKFVNNNEYINEEVVKNICISENGLFKNSKNHKYLFINKVDSDLELKKAENLASYLYNNIDNIGFKIVIGSLKKEVFYEY